MKMKSGIRYQKSEVRKILVAAVLLTSVVWPLTSVHAATNVQLNFTWQQINSNLALVAAGHVNWDLAYAWGNHALAGYATGTPLYVESDPAWHSGTGALWSAISAVSPAGYAGVSNAAVTAYGWGYHATNGYLTASNETALYTAISNAAPENYSAVSNAAMSAVQRIILNGITNTPTSGTVNLGTIESGGGAVTNVEIFMPNGIRLLSVYPEVASAGTAEANGAYADSGTITDGNPVYTNAACKIRYYTVTGKWQIENSAGSTTYYYQSSAQSVPWSGTWSTAAGTAPAPTVTAITNTVADLEEVAADAAESVKTVILNGVTNNPVGGAVDLGSISAGDPTNISINAASGLIEVYGFFDEMLPSGFVVYGAGYEQVNGQYNALGGGIFTNTATGAYAAYVEPDWTLIHGGNSIFGASSWTQTNAPIGLSWGFFEPIYQPLPSVTLTGSVRRVVADLTNSLQWVSAPTGSVATGRSGQVGVSADTNLS